MKQAFLVLILVFVSCVSWAQQVSDGTYYLQNCQNGQFLSRGADWGTRATFDGAGIPIAVKSGSNGYTLRYIDSEKFLGKDGEPYTDKSTRYPIQWRFVAQPEEKWLLQNVSSEEYLMNLSDGRASFTHSLEEAALLVLVDQAARDGMVNGRQDALADSCRSCSAIDVTELVMQSPDMAVSTEGWNLTSSKGLGIGSGLTELYEGSCSISQRIAGLEPGKLYRIMLPAFYRSGTNEQMSQASNNGFEVSNAIVYANESYRTIRSWAADRKGDRVPNSMAEAAACFDEGLYTNTLLQWADDQGAIVFGIHLPQINSFAWLIWGKVTIERIGDDDGIDTYRALLDNEIRKLEALMAGKDILPEDLLEEARQIIAQARQATTLEALQQAINEVRECYALLDAYRIEVTYNDPYKRYLFAYFPSNDNEHLYYAVSENGFDYEPLNNGERVMWSDTVAIKRGIRDPYMTRGVDGKTFYMVATDMRCAEGWASNRGIVMYKSTDLVHWQHSTVHFPERFPEWARVTRVWAPEVIWDPDYQNTDGTKGRYMVYFSLLTDDGQCKYDKVYYCYANDDFTDLISDPVFFYDRGSATIDADIIYDEGDRLYHMIYKNEGSGGICHVTAKRLTAAEGEDPGSQWGKPSNPIQQTSRAVEGGGLFRLINTNTWVVMYDCYTSGCYQFCTTADWKNYTFVQDTYTYGAFTPRHGSAVPVTAAEYNTLLRAFPTDGLEELEDTAIENLPTANVKTEFYSLSGQPLQAAPARGFVISHGRKVIR